MIEGTVGTGLADAGIPVALVPAVVHLSGPRRGSTERIGGDVLRIGTAESAEVRLDADGRLSPDTLFATLRRRGLTYELVAEPGRSVWVNGERTGHLVLASGDVLEIGKGGPVLRFRLYEAGSKAYKSVAQVFADCVDCARYSGGSWLGRAGILLAGIPHELATQTSRAFRGGVVMLLAVLAVSTGVLVRRSVLLERRLATEVTRVSGLAELLDRQRGNVLDPSELAGLRAELEANLSDATARLEALEERSGASGRVIRAAAQSTILLQGAFGFVDSVTLRPLRFVPGPDGRPRRAVTGEPQTTLDGDGPILESFFTGTAFVATDEGLLLTNRHVALPWEADAIAQRLREHGLVPNMRRFIAFLPGRDDPIDVELVLASEDADLAVLRTASVVRGAPSLPFSQSAPSAGDEVIVLGYPLGIQALIARTDAQFVERVVQEGSQDFWSVAKRLAEGGYIAPLASRGIVGQVTGRAIVYDAETTHGGSGGPVLGLSGGVLAINAGGLAQFGGSNFGVPVEHARALLRRVIEIDR